jgi:hypothetical protein
MKPAPLFVRFSAVIAILAWAGAVSAQALSPRAQLMLREPLNVPAMATVPKAHERVPLPEVAKALGVQASDLMAPIVLEPTALMRSGAMMAFHCPLYVEPNPPKAGFVPGYCEGLVWAALSFDVQAGKAYLIDCAVSPASVTYTLDPWTGVSGPSASTRGAEHALFVHQAAQTGRVKFKLTGNSVWTLHRCEITRAK